MGFADKSALVITTRVGFPSPAPAPPTVGNQRLASQLQVREGKVRIAAWESPAFLPLQPQQSSPSFLPACLPVRRDPRQNSGSFSRLEPIQAEATTHDRRICPRTRFDLRADLRHPEFQRTELAAKSALFPGLPQVDKGRAELGRFLQGIGFSAGRVDRLVVLAASQMRNQVKWGGFWKCPKINNGQ